MVVLHPSATEGDRTLCVDDFVDPLSALVFPGEVHWFTKECGEGLQNYHYPVRVHGLGIHRKRLHVKRTPKGDGVIELNVFRGRGDRNELLVCTSNHLGEQRVAGTARRDKQATIFEPSAENGGEV